MRDDSKSTPTGPPFVGIIEFCARLGTGAKTYHIAVDCGETLVTFRTPKRYDDVIGCRCEVRGVVTATEAPKRSKGDSRAVVRLRGARMVVGDRDEGWLGARRREAFGALEELRLACVVGGPQARFRLAQVGPELQRLLAHIGLPPTRGVASDGKES